MDGKNALSSSLGYFESVDEFEICKDINTTLKTLRNVKRSTKLNLKQSLDQLLQADTSIKRKIKNHTIFKNERFVYQCGKPITNHAITKSYLLEKDFKIDMSKYEENFLSNYRFTSYYLVIW